MESSVTIYVIFIVAVILVDVILAFDQKIVGFVYIRKNPDMVIKIR
jgi:hypothetical protein